MQSSKVWRKHIFLQKDDLLGKIIIGWKGRTMAISLQKEDLLGKRIIERKEEENMFTKGRSSW